MDKKINVSIDLTKIDRTRITERRYTNMQGHEVIEKNYSFDIVPVKEPKVIKEGPTWSMMKTHFVAEAQTKEERAAKKATKYMGSGFTFVDKVQEDVEELLDEETGEEIDPNSVPFYNL